MKLDRRSLLRTTGAAAAAVTAGGLGNRAFAADAIKVAGIHDVSGGLDIYGKPRWSTALTFAD